MRWQKCKIFLVLGMLPFLFMLGCSWRSNCTSFDEEAYYALNCADRLCDDWHLEGQDAEWDTTWHKHAPKALRLSEDGATVRGVFSTGVLKEIELSESIQVEGGGRVLVGNDNLEKASLSDCFSLTAKIAPGTELVIETSAQISFDDAAVYYYEEFSLTAYYYKEASTTVAEQDWSSLTLCTLRDGETRIPESFEENADSYFYDHLGPLRRERRGNLVSFSVTLKKNGPGEVLLQGLDYEVYGKLCL
jgi:hypothetical protein